VLGQVVSFVISFLLSIAFANLLPKEAFGTYRFILSLAGIVTAFSLTGMNTAVTRAVARGNDGVYTKSIPIQLRWGVLTALVSFAISAYYLLNHNSVLALGLLLVGVFMPLINAFSTHAAFFNGKKDFRRLMIFGLAGTLSTSIATLVGLLVTKSALALVFLYLLSTALSSIVLFFGSLKYVKKTPVFDNREAISYGKHLSASGFISIAAQNVDKVLVFHFLGSIDLAIYTFALLIPDYVGKFFKNIWSLSLPKFAVSDGSSSKFRSLFIHKMILLTIVVVILMIIYIMLAPFVFSIFYPTYTNAVPFSQVAALYLLVFVPVLSSSFFNARGKKKIIYSLSISESLFRVIATYVGVYYFGLWGAIWALVAFAIFSFCLSWLFVFKSVR